MTLWELEPTNYQSHVSHVPHAYHAPTSYQFSMYWARINSVACIYPTSHLTISGLTTHPKVPRVEEEELDIVPLEPASSPVF